MTRPQQRITVAIVVSHILLLACYTMPARWVPTRARYWSQAYARVLFHQDWRLFAPDPPACGCRLEVRAAASDAWVPLKNAHGHFIWRRMCANACRYADALRAPDAPVVRVPPALSTSLERMSAGIARSGPVRIRISSCANDRPVELLARSQR